MDDEVKGQRCARWWACSLCEQNYHGVVQCALGWGCWKTYVGRPETDWARRLAMGLLAGGLSDADHHEDALSVQEAELTTVRRLGDTEGILISQANLAITYAKMGRHEEALQMDRDVYSGHMKLHGEEHEKTLLVANNYANSLSGLQRFKEAKALFRKTMPVARRVLGDSHELTFKMRWIYAEALYLDPGATLHDLREAVTTLEDAERTARRVMGGAHPLTMQIEQSLPNARATLRARETPPPPSA